MSRIPSWAVDAVRDLPPVLGLAEAGAVLGVCPRTLRRWRDDGRIRILRTSASGAGRCRVTRDEVARVLAAMAGEEV